MKTRNSKLAVILEPWQGSAMKQTKKAVVRKLQKENTGVELMGLELPL